MSHVLERPETFGSALAEESLPQSWNVRAISCCDEIEPAVAAVVAAMTARGYPKADRFETTLILSEALTNAVKHGNCDDPAKRVVVSYHVGPDRVLLEVEDDGPGFDLAAIRDPTAPENLDRPCGRGLFLMRHYSTWLRFNESGNCVMLCKHRAERQR
jgi:serine/threonine-protein kinase RsbW